jgi:amino acid transporter
MSTLIFGIFQFYYTIAHEGKLSERILIFSGITLYLLPIISLIFHPYSIIEEWYGYELIIDPWFMILISITFMSFGFYAIIKLLLISLKTEDPTLKRRLKLTFLGLIIIGTGAILFFIIIPVFFNIQYPKPIGWLIVTIGVVIMAYSFMKRK